MRKFYKRGKLRVKFSIRENLEIFGSIFTEGIPESLNEKRLDIIDFLKDIRYKLSCLEDKLYGIEDDGNSLCDLEKLRKENEIQEQWHKKHPVFGYFIDLYNYFVYRLPDKIDMSWRRVYWFVQRGKRGYADIDVWNLYHYLAKIISGGTKQLREELHGYPTELTFKKWKKILKQISEGFELVQNDRFGITTVKDYKKNEKYYKQMRKKKENREFYPTKTEVKKIEKAFKLLQKHFASMWD